jgi:hypothetical protein
MQNQVEWSVLDIEEDEWNHHIAALDVAAVANGFPVVTPPGRPSEPGAAQSQDPYDLPQRFRDAADLIAVIAANYGLDSLKRLLTGFSDYEDWEIPSPAVFGLSGAELESAWHNAPGLDLKGDFPFALSATQ